ncbi:MAG: glycosyltransferase [Candidatus Berkelbacteria bacterium]|nr:glycosyltransferase [Candidatus Berkelbacteria bacterium]
MKIGLFTECYEPIINGVVHSMRNTKRGLEALGHEVFVFSPDYREKNIREKNVIPCPSMPLPGKLGYHFVYPLPKEVKNLAATMDIIHTHHPFTMGKYSSEIATANDIPFLFTHHTQYDQYTHYVPLVQPGAAKILYGFLKKFCDKCDVIIAPSAGIKKIIEGEYKTKTKVEVVPNSIDIKNFRKGNDLSTPRILGRLNPDYKIILYTGRVAKEKSIDFIIKAFKIAVVKYPEAYLLIVGGGPAIQPLQRLCVKLGLVGQVIFTDMVPYTQMKRFYNFGDLFITASTTEVHPLVLLEAMAAGLPIIAVDAIGTSDIVQPGHTGYIVRNDIKEFAGKLLYLLKNPTRLKIMSQNAAKEINYYSIPNMAKKMLGAYHDAIGIHKKNSRNYR